MIFLGELGALQAFLSAANAIALAAWRRDSGQRTQSGPIARGDGVEVYWWSATKEKARCKSGLVLILRRWLGLGMGAVRLVGVTACQEYTTRQTLKQEHSAPSLSRTR